MDNSQEKILNIIAQAIYDKKGMNILTLDVRGICSMTDFFVIAEGTVDRHIRAIAGAIEDELRSYKIRPLFAEGMKEGDWVVLDFGHIVVHLFTPELREKYTLEQLWQQGKIVDLDIKLS